MVKWLQLLLILKVENKILDISFLASTIVLNTKTGEAENKIPDVSGLVKKTVYEKMSRERYIYVSLLLIRIILWVTIYLMQR